MVARGLIVHPAVASMTRQFSRDDISLTAITDLPPIRLGLILCPTHYNARIRALAATARGIYRPSAQGSVASAAHLAHVLIGPDSAGDEPLAHARSRIVNARITWGSRCQHTPVCDTVVCVAQVDRFSVTMPPDLGEGVRQAAARQGTSVSTWLTEAAADKLRNELLGAALDQWEAEDGPFTADELDEAASRLGLAPRRDVA